MPKHEATDGQPLLTIAIPTFRRAAQLKLLLEALAPQLAEQSEVELIISDNASPDETPQVVESFCSRGLRCRYLRNAENLDADPNFLQCYDQAAGKYVWIFSDDDILLPGSLGFVLELLRGGEYELLYLQPFGFVHDIDERGQRNPAPCVIPYDAAHDFVRGVGLRGDLVLISSVIFNKERIESGPHPDFTAGRETNLLQMGWVFTALRHFRRGLIVERGLYAVCELDPQRQFNIVRTFGPYWARMARLFLAPDEELIEAVLNDQLYSWWVTNWYGMRRKPGHTQIIDPVAQMRPVYGGRLRFWLLTWPLLAWPMFPAGVWLAMLRAVRKADLFFHRRRFRPLRHGAQL